MPASAASVWRHPASIVPRDEPGVHSEIGDPGQPPMTICTVCLQLNQVDQSVSTLSYACSTCLGVHIARVDHSAHTSTSSFNKVDSNESFQGSLGDFDIMSGQTYAISDDSMAFIDVDSLLSNNSIQQLDYTTSPRTEARQALEATVRDTAGSMSFMDESSSLHDTQHPLNRLFEIQTRLSKFSTPFKDRSDATGDIEAIHQITQAMITVIDGIEDQAPGQPETRGSGCNAAVILLLSSCYTSLIRVYQSLVEMLGSEVNDSPSPISNVPGMKQTNVPQISVGYLRLSMPRKAAAEVNMHLVAHTIKHLRSALQQCAARIRSPCPNFQSSTGDVSMRQDSDLSRGGDALRAMVSQALVELSTGEDKLVDHIRDAMMTLSTRSANII